MPRPLHQNVFSFCWDIEPTETYLELVKLKADLSHIWLCMRNGNKHCGKCKKCVLLHKEIFSKRTDYKTLTFKKALYGKQDKSQRTKKSR